MLIVLCGKSGSGKSAIAKEIEKYGYEKIITDTTRPPREGEINEVDYFFDTEEQFDELLNEGEFLETTQYKVASGDIWRYGTTIGAVAEAADKSVIILNPYGLRAMKEHEIKHKSVLIESNETVLLSRLQKRGDWKAEVQRRIETDRKDFEGVSEEVDFIVYNEKNTDIKNLAKAIVELVEGCEE